MPARRDTTPIFACQRIPAQTFLRRRCCGVVRRPTTTQPRARPATGRPRQDIHIALVANSPGLVAVHGPTSELCAARRPASRLCAGELPAGIDRPALELRPTFRGRTFGGTQRPPVCRE